MTTDKRTPISETPPPLVEIDLQEFAAHLDGFDLSPSEQLAVLQAYWPIILAFVDLGFGLSPTQQSCGQRAQSADHRAAAPACVVKSDHHSNAEMFNATTQRSAP